MTAEPFQPRTRREVICHWNHGVKLNLMTGEAQKPDGTEPRLSGQRLRCVQALIDAQGLPVLKIEMERDLEIVDQRAVIRDLRRFLDDNEEPYRYIRNTPKLGYFMPRACYELEINELPSIFP